jgi:hypothetical protein
MHATRSGKEPDVPQDPNVVPPRQNLTDAEELLAKLAKDAASLAANRRSDTVQIDFSAGPRVTAPSLDIAARALDDVQPSRQLKSHRRRGMRGSIRYLLAASIGVAVTLAWQSYGEVGNHMIATFIAQRGLSSSLHMLQPVPSDLNRESSAAAVHPNTADAAPTAALAEAAPHPAAPATAVAPAAPSSAEFTQQIETIVHDITALRQSMEQLTNAQSQIARTLAAMRSAEDARHAQPAPPPPPAVTRKRGDTRAPQQRLPQLAPGPRPLSQSFEPSPPPAPPQPPAPMP